MTESPRLPGKGRIDVGMAAGARAHALVVGSAIGRDVCWYLVAIPLVVARLPSDYFTHAQRPAQATTGAPLLVRLGKNLLGILIVLVGVAMWGVVVSNRKFCTLSRTLS